MWTVKDAQKCYKEGFGVFTCDDGQIRLQKLDDPDADGWEVLRMFRSDRAAAKYVQRQAKGGNAFCRKVIEFLIEKQSPDVREFNLERTWV